MSNKIFEISQRQARRDYTKFNRLIFCNVLPPTPSVVTVRRLHKVWGWCHKLIEVDNGNVSVIIEITNKYPDRQTYQSVLAHEMVHAYQFLNGDTGNHNQMFYSFRDVFELNDLTLKRIM